MLENTTSFIDRCSDSDCDNISIDSLEIDNGKSATTHAEEQVSGSGLDATVRSNSIIKKSQHRLIDENYREEITGFNGSPFDNDIETLTEAIIPKVDILLPDVNYLNAETTKFERKSAQKKSHYRRTQSEARTIVKESTQLSLANTNCNVPVHNSNSSKKHAPRSKSVETKYVQPETSRRSPEKKQYYKLNPKGRHAKKSMSYLEQYREKNPQNRLDIEVASGSQSELSVTTCQNEEAQYYSDIINGRIKYGSHSEYSSDENYHHELSSASDKDLRSISEIHFDNGRGLNYVPYTVKDHVLVMPTKLGSLGPDPYSSREKAEKCKKRQEYGIFASLKNMEIIRHRNLKKKISEAISDMNNLSSCNIRSEVLWENNSNGCDSSSDRNVDILTDSCKDDAERSKKQYKFGCRKLKKNTLPIKPPNIKAADKESTEGKSESNLDLINRLLRERNKTELTIKTFENIL